MRERTLGGGRSAAWAPSILAAQSDESRGEGLEKRAAAVDSDL
jgi:hypothetical protein